MHCSLGDNTIYYQELGTTWRRDNSSPSGRICSIESRPIQERRRIPIARPSRNEVKCHGNVYAETSFNLGKRSCGQGLMSRWFGTRHFSNTIILQQFYGPIIILFLVIYSIQVIPNLLILIFFCPIILTLKTTSYFCYLQQFYGPIFFLLFTL